MGLEAGTSKNSHYFVRHSVSPHSIRFLRVSTAVPPQRKLTMSRLRSSWLVEREANAQPSRISVIHIVFARVWRLTGLPTHRPGSLRASPSPWQSLTAALPRTDCGLAPTPVRVSPPSHLKPPSIRGPHLNAKQLLPCKRQSFRNEWIGKQWGLIQAPKTELQKDEEQQQVGKPLKFAPPPCNPYLTPLLWSATCSGCAGHISPQSTWAVF